MEHDSGAPGAALRYLDAETATWQEAEAFLKRFPAAILPLGATEQHGPHLPQSTDTLIAGAVCRRVAERVGGYLLPVLPITYSRVWHNVPGTPWIQVGTFIALVKDIVRSLERSGVRAMLIITGHSANQQPLKYAVREMKDEGSRMAILYGGLMGVEGPLGEMESRLWRGAYELHAEELETSLVLAIAPELVRMERAVADYPEMPDDFGHTADAMGDVMRSGVFGDATKASREKGDRWLARIVDRTAELWAGFLRRHGIDV